MHIGVVGSGHAGVEAAAAASDGGAEVVLFGNEAELPYYRPRLVALAFGQAETGDLRMKPAEWYAARRIDLRRDASVQRLSAESRAILAGGREERFDALVLCAGARPIRPADLGATGEAIHTLWSMAEALAVRRRVKAGESLTVLGGGILGIEAALRAIGTGLRVCIVEKCERLMPAQFGPRASRVLRSRLEARGIRVETGRTVSRLTPVSGDRVVITLDNGDATDACICLVCIGASPNLLLAGGAGLQVDRGVVTDDTLRTSAALVFAAGDLAQAGGRTRCSAREAAAQGRLAGTNAVAAVRGETLQRYVPQTLPLTFKSGDFELYAVGAPGGEGYEEHPLDGSTESVLRSVIKRNGRLCGVQMIGTRQGFDDYLAQVTSAAGV
jgi:nitrite reductase (NADH) large subunit